MFTGIVQGIARVEALADRPGLRSFTLRFPPGFGAGLAIGASVAVDGVCLTVTTLQDEGAASFVKSWNELMGVIASKRSTLEKVG